jgi:hypothetical protein
MYTVVGSTLLKDVQIETTNKLIDNGCECSLGQD